MNLNWLTKILKDLISRKFYGKLTISFESGKIVNVNKSGNLRPE